MSLFQQTFEPVAKQILTILKVRGMEYTQSNVHEIIHEVGEEGYSIINDELPHGLADIHLVEKEIERLLKAVPIDSLNLQGRLYNNELFYDHFASDAETLPSIEELRIIIEAVKHDKEILVAKGFAPKVVNEYLIPTIKF